MKAWLTVTAVLWAPVYLWLAATEGVDPAYEVVTFLWCVGMVGVWRGVNWSGR